MGGRIAAADQFGILDLYSRYSWGLDTVDLELYLSAFAENGRYNECEGRANLAANFERLTGTEHWAGSQHYNGQLLFLSANSARCSLKCYSTIVYRLRDGSAGIRHLGIYRDICVKTDDSWVFEDRQWEAWDPDKMHQFGS